MPRQLFSPEPIFDFATPLLANHELQRPNWEQPSPEPDIFLGGLCQEVWILAELFVDTSDADYLYNQGRCYEQNVRYVEAAERFKEYLRKKVNITDADKADVNKHIADCEAAVAKTRAPVAGGSTQPAPAAPPPAPSMYAPVSPAPVYAYAPPAPPSLASLAPVAPSVVERHGWQRTAKWAASGAAVAFLGLGIVEHINYYRKNSDFNNNPDCPNRTPGECNSLASSADKAQTVAFIGYGAAAVATGAAIVFWLTDAPLPAEPRQARFACLPALAGVACQGSF